MCSVLAIGNIEIENGVGRFVLTPFFCTIVLWNYWLNATQSTALTFTTTQANVKCNGGSDASITVNGAGGVTPYTYSIDDSVTFPNTTGTFNSLGAGVYKIGLNP